MHFLLINQFFAPDPAPTGQLLGDVASELAALGHRVTVLCSRADYASAPAHSKAADIPGVTVYRVPALPFRRTRFARAASYAGFYAAAVARTVAVRKPDVVLTLTTPPLLSLTGTLMRLLRGTRHFIWEMDLYPDVATALGVIHEGGWVDRATGALADFARRRSDGVVALGPCMRDRLLARGIPAGKLSVVENWVGGAEISPRPFPPDAPFTVLYSGNLGLAHETETLARAIERLDPARFRFIFAGGGTRRPGMELRLRMASNVEFAGYEDAANLSEHFGRCHVGVVTQRPDTLGTLVPGKTYAYMAAGRPFLFIGPSDATPARSVARYGCGWHVEPGDATGVATLLETLAASPDLAHAAGERARAAFERFHSRELAVSRIVDVLLARNSESEARVVDYATP